MIYDEANFFFSFCNSIFWHHLPFIVIIERKNLNRFLHFDQFQVNFSGSQAGLGHQGSGLKKARDQGSKTENSGL